jgi:hypothetical protein
MGMEELEALEPGVERCARAYVIVWGVCVLMSEAEQTKQRKLLGLLCAPKVLGPKGGARWAAGRWVPNGPSGNGSPSIWVTLPTHQVLAPVDH